ncbi:hypothetical protein OIU74_003927 [Salix koriyanagi]|uniref:Uncharacterized protein n=1 Tax=Salix koriyanagi TaxID=2511006 RepID=A0A9Q0ZLQ6_9ROSI|nr:hypothetical protein OIU74_003927 [Salix koriyanagi]
MAFAAPIPAAAHARQPVPKKPTSNKQHAPMVEAVTADVWQPVPRKHINNRLAKVWHEYSIRSGWSAGRGCSSSFNCGSFGPGSGSIFNGYFGC